MFNLFSKKPKFGDIETKFYNIEELNASQELLSSTASEVANAAQAAAETLKQQLFDSESRLYGIIDSIDDFVLIKDAKGRWKTLNSFGQKLYGFYNFEYFEKTDEDLIKEYPNLKEYLKSCNLSDSRAWKNKNPIRYEESFNHNNNFLHFDIIKTPVFDDSGNKKELIIVGRNITEIKNKNARVKACFNALNAASDIITIFDNKGNIIFCNDKFLNKFKYKDYHDVVGKNIGDFFENVDPIWITLKLGKMWIGNMWTNFIDNKKLKCKSTILPVMNGVPEPIYYICTLKQT